MSHQSDILVQIDDRIRLTAMALAATQFPQMAQERKRHHAHSHARATSKYLHDNRYSDHPAIKTLQRLLEEKVPLEAIFTLVAHGELPRLTLATPPTWMPPKWNEMLWDFYEKSQAAQFFSESAAVWDNALVQSRKVFDKIQFKPFLAPFFGEIAEDLVFMPNICYPADHEIGVRILRQLMVIVPPPLAWGDSPPWPYDEDTMLTQSYRAALAQYGRLLLVPYLRTHADKVKEASQKELPISDQLKALHPTWEEQFTTLFMSSIVAIYLEDHVSAAEARAFQLMEKKLKGMTILPGAVNVFRRYLQEHGKRYHELSDFLTVFPTQLRVAKKIISL